MQNLFQQLASEITTQLQILQELACVIYLINKLSLTFSKAFMGEITDDDILSMPTFFYDLPSTFSRRNPYIFVNSQSGWGQTPTRNSLRIFNLPDVFSHAGFQTTDGSFVVPSECVCYIYFTVFMVNRSGG